MLRRLLLTAVVALGLVLTVSVPLAYAHRTGSEVRTFRGCRDLRPGLRAACRACIARKHPHHFHVDYPAGQRCRPNNGQP